ncbi:bifunctional sugar-1-phosphate nucleotidylyltransferase/acetyltransferase [Methanoregula sp.]|uniref:bifunctional sugar-1-phosphate nucleotidylyltransferase/acetyltransferase n=1 Tax=Methanoregula sp. TaxID=2052170 RepID=UPI00236B2DFD|nr:bifunctional sugar-1-phosphate nucleotidylyltransferase/acetyltransferase [Methanoregula sp.]MDD1687670.1 NTP transferase domain-containing protein [Methanoregula sp.]
MQAVILAAGEGRRVRPLTRSRPKAMIPVANRPIIEYVIEALVKNGIRDIIVVVGYRKEQVTRYLNQMDIPVDVVVQNKQLGTGHALLSAESKIHDNFLVLPGDNYIDPSSIARIKDIPNAMLVKEHQNPSNFGVVMLHEDHVTNIVEKPAHAPSFMVSTGIYSLTREVFGHIRENNLTDAISSLIKSGVKIQGIPADDWQDAIFAWDLLKMNRRLLPTISPSRDGSASRQTIIQGAVRIGKGTTIGPNTVITGPVVIGNDCVIGPNCCILPNTSIGSRVKIEPFTIIGESIIMDDTVIGSHSRIIDTVTGERCILADHTSTWTTSGILDFEGLAVRSEFGAILGDSITCGPFSIMKNSMIGNSVTIEGRASLSSRYIPDNSTVI